MRRVISKLEAIKLGATGQTPGEVQYKDIYTIAKFPLPWEETSSSTYYPAWGHLRLQCLTL